MDTRKTTLIITIAVIALLSVGIGFAYVAYTSNSGNNTDVAYITVSQDDGDGHAKYTFTDADTKIYFDTFTNKDDTYFKLNAQNAVTTAKAGFPEYTFVDLGAVRLVAEYEGTGNAPSPLYVSIIASDNFDGNDNWVYFLTNKYSVDNEKKTSNIMIYAYTNNDESDWINGPDALTITATNNVYEKPEIHLCYGYPTALANIDFDDDVEELKGYLRVAHDPDDLQDASIVIKASETDPGMKATKVITYCSDNSVNALKYIALVENGTTYAFVNNESTLFDSPIEGKVFGGWKDSQGQDIPATKQITADTTVYAKWVDPPTP